MKQRYGREKKKRLSGYITEAFQMDLKKMSQQTGVSQADLLEIAFYEMRDRKIDLFICCPSCGAPYCPKALLTVSGTLEAKCNECGADFEYNEDESENDI